MTFGSTDRRPREIAHSAIARSVLWLTLTTALAATMLPLHSRELEPARTSRPLGAASIELARYSDRTIRAAVEVSRDGARLVAYTLKNRPFSRPTRPVAARAYREGRPLQLELVLYGEAATRLTQRVDAGPVCLTHGPDAEPHVEGDTILLHRETFIVELPEVAGLDHLELAYHESERGHLLRRSLGADRLDLARFTPAGGPVRYTDLRIADENADAPAAASSSSGVFWPEDFGDSERYRVWGDPAAGDERITIVMVPDGYTYAEKARMETHAENMVQHFRTKTPYAEHDLFINYVLVYAYSAESGTDECDCDLYRDTAMGTRFPDAGQPCGHSANRCLYYGSGCDTNSTGNIAAAELRAPSHDTTVVLVNTTRYGGCGGYRAVFSAGNSQGNEVAVHELGHTLAGLADEYGGNGSCGNYAGEINTSSNAVAGAWSEWIDDLGGPVEGAQYYDSCLYRPTASCEMRSLNQTFCPVCNQRWALTFFSHPRIAPSAPIRGIWPPSPAEAHTDIPSGFSVDVRLPGGNATHRTTWRIKGPDDMESTVVSEGSTSLLQTFDSPGLYELSCEVVADSNFVKPSRNGPNVDTATWTVAVTDLEPPGEVSPADAPIPLLFLDKQVIVWGEASGTAVDSYNLYRGRIDELPSGDYGSCLKTEIPGTSTTDSQEPSQSTGWTYLISGKNLAGEGPLGLDWQGSPRSAQTGCP